MVRAFHSHLGVRDQCLALTDHGFGSILWWSTTMKEILWNTIAEAWNTYPEHLRDDFPNNDNNNNNKLFKKQKLSKKLKKIKTSQG